MKNNIEKIKFIKNKIENETIFIELIGTPESGKTTLMPHIQSYFMDNEIKCQTRSEITEKNPIDKGSKYFIMYNYFELLKKLYVDISKPNSGIIIYDRGVLDRIIWLKYQLLNKAYSIIDYKRFTNLYKTKGIRNYKPISTILITSPETAVKRKGKEGKVVNIKSITRFNKLLNKTLPLIKRHSSSYNIVCTDDYQGKTDVFIKDNIEKITDEVYIYLKNKENCSNKQKHK